jgi:hypothetical protein
MKAVGTADLKSNVFGRRFVRCNETNLGYRMGVRIPSSSSKTRLAAKRYQLRMRCPCNISLMFMHESPSYNITPQLYTVTIGIVGHSSARGQCCHQTCTDQLASLMTSYLYARLSSIFMAMHAIWLQCKKKWYCRHNPNTGRARED